MSVAKSPLRTLVLAATLLGPGLAWGQGAILHPNQVQTSLVFTNTNPTIRGLLDPTMSETYTWSLYAGSVAPAPQLSASAFKHGHTRATVSGEITVESSDTGIAYGVELLGFRGSSDRLAYKTRTLVTAPIQVEPGADGVADFAECAGLLQLALHDATGNVVVATGGKIDAKLVAPGDPLNGRTQASDWIAPGSSVVGLLVRGDSTFDITARFTVGTDAYSDMITYEIKMRVFVPCDGIAAVDGVCSGGGPSGDEPFTLARVVGEADVLGEVENVETGSSAYTETTSIRFSDGPWGNYRYDKIQTAPASGFFELENLVPSTVVPTPDPYDLRCQFSLRGGRQLQNLQLDQLRVIVHDGEDLDIDDTCVVDPAFVRGDIFLAAPPPDPGFAAPLSAIFRPGDDGTADSFDLNWASRVRSELRSDLLAGEGTFLPGIALANFEGEYDAPSGDFLGHHEIVVGGFHGGGTTVSATQIKLFMQALDTPDAWPTYVNGSVDVEEIRTGVHVSPGDIVDEPVRQCHSTLMVQFLSTGVPFTRPELRTPWFWTWSGLDFEGRMRTREIWMRSEGTPVGGSTPSTTGLIVTSLPEGDYHLLPSVYSANPSGGTSLTEILPVDVTVGCREVIGLYPDFVLAMSPLPPCTEGGTLTLRGQVTGAAEIARIKWSVNGGPDQVSCLGCGVEPAFELPVTMLDEDAEVVVTAEAVDGRLATRTAFSRFSEEPSATDRRTGAPPLLVTKSGDDVVLTWETYGGNEASVYRGTIASLHSGRAYDHAGFGQCHLVGGTTTLTPADVPTTSYFLVGAPCGWGDSSLGRDSFGAERPAALLRCTD